MEDYAPFPDPADDDIRKPSEYDNLSIDEVMALCK